jgi:hydroxymethylpyrimidine/phosphomethylpyrimidine kinase
VVATPLNDAQLVSLVAAQVVAGLGLGCDPKTAVERATEIVAEAVIQTANLPALVRAKQKAREVT